MKHNWLTQSCEGRVGEGSSVKVHVDANGEIQFNVNLAALFLIRLPMVFIFTQATSV